MIKINKLGYMSIGVILALILGTTTPASAAAKEVIKQLTACFTSGGKAISLYVNGTKVDKDSNGKAVTPFVVDGTTYLPVRAISDVLGKGVTWDGSTASVKITDKTATTSDTTSIKTDDKTTPTPKVKTTTYQDNDPNIIVTKDENGAIHEVLKVGDYEDDKDAMGQWEQIGFVKTPEDFDGTDSTKRSYIWPWEIDSVETLEKFDSIELTRRDFVDPITYTFYMGCVRMMVTGVHSDGNKEFVPLAWTKGYIASMGNGYTVSHYEIQHLNGKTFMFIQFKGDNYTIRGQKPFYIVLIKTSDMPDPRARQIPFKVNGVAVNLPGSIKDDNAKLTTTIDADGKWHDKLDYTFTSDKDAGGEWQYFNKYDYLYMYYHFNPNDAPHSPTSWSGISIYDDGIMYEHGTTNGKRYDSYSRWTKGYIGLENSEFISAYAITTINGKTFMIVEHKNGDYVRTGNISEYYVFVKTSDTPAPPPAPRDENSNLVSK
ncbi:MAG TPA: copper amine oxidase N-terminal domain-containing protein [Pseudobacteroides sp.]|uniref:copper amine oxidase N-terminal domain-containing protein n=1 Tax=Pseudobacteroides sp. TaxID=1968840 RepID=UPI002F929213